MIARSPGGAQAVAEKAEPGATNIMGILDGFGAEARLVVIDANGRGRPSTIRGKWFEVDQLPRGEAVVRAWESSARGVRAAMAQVQVQPPAPSKVTLQPLPTYAVTGTLRGARQQTIAADCTLRLPEFGRFEVPVSDVGGFTIEVPVGVSGVLVCSSGEKIIEYTLSDETVAGSVIEVSSASVR